MFCIWNVQLLGWLPYTTDQQSEKSPLLILSILHKRKAFYLKEHHFIFRKNITFPILTFKLLLEKNKSLLNK